MKKLLAILTSVILLMSLITPVTLAEGNCAISVSASPVQSGEFTASVMIDANPGFSSLNLTVSFDNSKLELTSVTAGNALPGNITLSTSQPGVILKDVSTVSCSWAATTDTTSVGTVFSMSFRIKDGDWTSTDVYVSDCEAINGNLSEVAATVTAATITNQSAPTEGYSVALSQNTSIKLNETADATVTVSNGSEGVTGYNAYRIVLSYDADKLSYEGINLTDASVVNGNGTLTITGYGADKTCGTDNIVATFKGIAAGEAKVSITAANIDIKDNACVQDAPAATIATGDITITTSDEHSVNLKDWFIGNATVANGKDYTFTAKDNHYNYTVAATMGGSSVTVTDNGNGTFTIANVIGDLVIDAQRTPKTYGVTVTGTGTADITAGATATYLADYTFTVAKDSAYTYEVSASADNGAIAVTPNEDGTTYTISGVNVTGNITITVNKTLKPVETTKIIFQGEGAADVVGGSEQTANNGQDFSFTLNKKVGYNYTVKLGADTIEPNTDGGYTIPGANINGTDITVTVEKESAVIRAIEVYEYVKLNEKSMFLVIADGKAVDSNVLTYDSNIMFWSEKYNAYAYLVVSDKTLDEIKAEAESKIGEAAAMTTSIEYDGDVNMSGVIDVNDAQLTWNVYNAMYEDFNAVSMEKLLRADVNGDKTVDTKDSAAIIAIVTK